MRIVLSLSLMFIASVASAQDNIGGSGSPVAPRAGPPWERGLSNPNPGCSGESQAALVVTIVLFVVGLLIFISMSRRTRQRAHANIGTAPANIEERIKKLSELRDAGLITAEEQEARRREILKDI